MSEYVFDRDEINGKTPFTVDESGRVIPNAIVYDPNFTSDELPEYANEQDWLTYHPSPDGGLMALKGGEVYKGTYFGKKSAKPEDIQIPFISFYYQHGSFPNILEYFESIEEDLRNLASCLSKFAIYQHISEEFGMDVNQFVLTEFEYIFSVCRSIFDTLHCIASESWDVIELTEGGQNELPNKLSSMVLNKYTPVSSDALVENYGLTETLANFYETLAKTLSDIKYHRDSIHHYGGSFKHIFNLEDGLAVDTSLEPYSEFDAWEESQINENELAPIWPFVAQILGSTIETMNNLPEAMFEGILVPDEIAPGYGVYLRGPHITNLLSINDLQEDDPWGNSLVGEIEKTFNSGD